MEGEELPAAGLKHGLMTGAAETGLKRAGEERIVRSVGAGPQRAVAGGVTDRVARDALRVLPSIVVGGEEQDVGAVSPDHGGGLDHPSLPGPVVADQRDGGAAQGEPIGGEALG